MPFKDKDKQIEYFRAYDAKRKHCPKRAAERRAKYAAEVALHGRAYINARNAASRAKRSEFYRKWRRDYKGLPEPTRPEPAMCEVCAWPRTEAQSLCLDHDHVTGQFRGWLCRNCNLGIGSLGDDLASLRRAVAYLEKNA
jgi:Recombination endonuclease VII